MTAKRVLIVEDEPLIAMMLEDFLDLHGHAVAGSAATVAEALTVIATGDVDAAIVDLNLAAGEKSWPVADALADGGIPFIFATGGSEDGLDGPHAGRPVLPKPYTSDDVARAMDAIT